MKKQWLGNALATGFILTSCLTGSAFAAMPDNLQMSADIILLNGSEKMSISSTTYIMKDKIRIETKSHTPMVPTQSGMPPIQDAVILMDNATRQLYMLNEQSKTALKLDASQSMGQLGLTGGMGVATDRKKVTEELKSRKGKMIGAATILGQQCDIWEVPTQTPDGQQGTIKMWLSRDLKVPMKAEMTSKARGKVMNFETTALKLNPVFKTNMFAVPAGYKVTDMAALLKQLQNNGAKGAPKGK